MKNFHLAYLFLTLLVLGCDSGSEDPTDEGPVQTTDDDIVLDETPPVITVSELPEVLDVTTQLSISVADASDEVTTTVLIDGAAIFETDQKSFSLDVNPFDYPIGDKDIEIRAVDDVGNESVLIDSFELKRLLIRIPNPTRGSELDLVDVYYAINDLMGNMIAYEKVEMEGSLDFFSDDSFSFQEITLTRYLIGKSPQSFQFFSSASNLRPGTILPSDEESGTFREEPGIFPENNFDISVESTYLPELRSYNAILASTSGFSGNYNITYNNLLQSGEGEILFSFPVIATPISEYEYLVIDDFSQLSYELDDFKTPNSFSTIKLPESGDFYSVVINGFYTEEDYQNYRYKQIFRNRDEMSKLANNALEIPVLEEFEVFQRQLSINNSTSKKRFETLQKGINEEFLLPDFDISRSDRLISFTGNYDYSEFFFDKFTFNGDGSFNQFFWSFKNRPTNDDLEIPYYSFELPQEVSQELSLKSQSANPDEITPDSFTCQMYRFDTEGSYEDILFFAKSFAEGVREDEYSLTLDLQ